MKYFPSLVGYDVSPRLSTSRRGIASAFILPEVLIASIIFGIVGVLATQLMIGQLMVGRRLESSQRLRENLSRFNYLVQIESAEAESIDLNAQPNGCLGGSRGFTLLVPNPSETSAASSNSARIKYYDDGVNIYRCGPSVARNGELVHAVASNVTTNVTGIVLPNAVLSDVNCGASSCREVSYRVELIGGNSATAGADRVFTAHSKKVFVCNPATVSSGGTTGICP
jgi:hypothetical protein